MPEVAVRELTMAEAVREALSEEMRRDPGLPSAMASKSSNA